MTYNPAMRVAVISDVHCGDLGCRRSAAFVRWLDELEADALWMLGDIFHYGWVFGGRLQPEYQPVFEALDRAAGRGLRMVFVPGNHDFRMGALMASRWGAEVAGPHTREVDGVRIHISHGDEADTGLGYRAVDGFLRGRIVDWFMRLLGVRFGTAVLRHIAGEAGEADGEVWPSTLQALSEHLVGADMAIMGHAHVPWTRRDGRGVGVILGPGVPGAICIDGGQLKMQAD